MSELGLGPARAGALAALLGAVAVWGAAAGSLPAVSDPWDVALTALVLIPATFAVVWLALPLVEAPPLPLIGAAVSSGVGAVALAALGADAVAEAARLLALVLAGFAFLAAFEAASWVALVALVIPWVDIASVYRGPTKVVVEQRPGLFERISIGFRLPGEGDGARLGPPDVLFFALFLGATRRFGLRTGWTWLGMTAGLGLTLVATYVFDLSGLPALPAIALGFLVPNADRLWRSARAGMRATDA